LFVNTNRMARMEIQDLDDSSSEDDDTWYVNRKESMLYHTQREMLHLRQARKPSLAWLPAHSLACIRTISSFD
jgi:hypothetical protein